MVSDLDLYRDDSPAFSSTVFNIMDRYRTSVVERHTASRALSAITMALAPEDLLDGHAEEKLENFFNGRLDLYHAGNNPDIVKQDVIRVMMAAAEADWDVLHHFGLWR